MVMVTPLKFQELKNTKLVKRRSLALFRILTGKAP